MSIFKSTAIIFRSIKYGESSIIVEIYTRERGVRSFIVSGVRSSRKNSKAALYQVMNIVDIVAYDKSDNKLARIKEIKLHRLYNKLGTNIIKSSIATMMTEVSRNAIKEQEANHELYDFLEKSFVQLDQSEGDLTIYPLLFMINLASHLGIAPSNDFSELKNQFDLTEGCFVPYASSRNECMTPEVSRFFTKIMQRADDIKIPKSIRTSMLQNLVSYYQYHLPSFAPIKSLQILSAVLA